MQLFGIVFFALTIPLSAVLAERGRRRTLIGVTVGNRRVRPGDGAAVRARARLGRCWRWSLGLSLMGLTYGPLGTVLSELFPTAVRYTGSSLTFNLAGIFGASLAPYVATWLATHVRAAVRRLLPDRRRTADHRRPAGDSGDQG